MENQSVFKYQDYEGGIWMSMHPFTQKEINEIEEKTQKSLNDNVLQYTKAINKKIVQLLKI